MSQRSAVEELVNKMKEDSVVAPSNSPYNSPLLLIPKKNGQWRLVIDFSKLNRFTMPDRMPMPIIGEVLNH